MIERIATNAAERLFTNGFGEQASQLHMMRATSSKRGRRLDSMGCGYNKHGERLQVMEAIREELLRGAKS